MESDENKGYPDCRADAKATQSQADDCLGVLPADEFLWDDITTCWEEMNRLRIFENW